MWSTPMCAFGRKGSWQRAYVRPDDIRAIDSTLPIIEI